MGHGGNPTGPFTVIAFIVVAYVAMAYVAMACVAMACIAVVHTVMAYPIMARVAAGIRSGAGIGQRSPNDGRTL